MKIFIIFITFFSSIIAHEKGEIERILKTRSENFDEILNIRLRIRRSEDLLSKYLKSGMYVQVDLGERKIFAIIVMVTSNGIDYTSNGTDEVKFASFRRVFPISPDVLKEEDYLEKKFSQYFPEYKEISEILKWFKTDLIDLENQGKLLNAQLEEIERSLSIKLEAELGKEKNLSRDIEKFKRRSVNPGWKAENKVYIPRGHGPPTIARITEVYDGRVKVNWDENEKVKEKVIDFEDIIPIPGSKKEESIIKSKRLIQLMKRELIDIWSEKKALEEKIQLATAVKYKSRISKYQCQEISFNNRDLMAADTNQRNSSLCWAHSAAGLLEEQLCLSSQEKRGFENNCQKRVSRSEVAARVYEGNLAFHLSENSAGRTDDALEYYVSRENRGMVCLDKYGKNPYDVKDKEYIEDLKHLYENYPAHGIACRSDDISDFIRILYSNFASIREFLTSEQGDWTHVRRPQGQLDSIELFRILKGSANKDQFVQNVLLFNCQDDFGRRSFLRPGIDLEVRTNIIKSVKYLEEDKSELETYLSEFRNARKSGHSLSLQICYSYLVKEIAGDGIMAQELAAHVGKCGVHEVVASAARWNEETSQCQVYVKNSHGENAKLNSSWYPAEQIFKHTLQTSHLHIKGK